MLYVCQESFADPGNKNQACVDFAKLREKDELVARIIQENKTEFKIRSDENDNNLVWRRISKYSFKSLLSVSV